MDVSSYLNNNIGYLSARLPEVITYTEAELLQGLQSHEESAFSYLYDHYSKALFAVILPIVVQQDLAEDVLQEGFVKVFKNLHQYKFEGELGGWIRKIMVNTAINYLKKHRRYQTELLFSDDQLHVVAEDHPEIHPSTMSNHRSRRAALRMTPKIGPTGRRGGGRGELPGRERGATGGVARLALDYEASCFMCIVQRGTRSVCTLGHIGAVLWCSFVAFRCHASADANSP